MNDELINRSQVESWKWWLLRLEQEDIPWSLVRGWRLKFEILEQDDDDSRSKCLVIGERRIRYPVLYCWCNSCRPPSPLYSIENRARTIQHTHCRNSTMYDLCSMYLLTSNFSLLSSKPLLCFVQNSKLYWYWYAGQIYCRLSIVDCPCNKE